MPNTPELPNIFVLTKSTPLYHITVLNVSNNRATLSIEIVDTNGGEESPWGANFLFQVLVEAHYNAMQEWFPVFWNRQIASGADFRQRAEESKMHHTLAEWARLIIPQRYPCSAPLAERLTTYQPEVSEVMQAMGCQILSYGPTGVGAEAEGHFWVFPQARQRIKNLAAEWLFDINRIDFGHIKGADIPGYERRSGGWCYAWAHVGFSALSPHLLHHLIPGANWETTLWEFE